MLSVFSVICDQNELGSHACFTRSFCIRQVFRTTRLITDLLKNMLGRNNQYCKVFVAEKWRWTLAQYILQDNSCAACNQGTSDARINQQGEALTQPRLGKSFSTVLFSPQRRKLNTPILVAFPYFFLWRNQAISL